MLEDAKLDDNNAANGSNEQQSFVTSFVSRGTTYATSLFWQPLRNSDDPYTEIAEAAENILEGADLFALRKGKSPQFGLCISSQGYKRGVKAAAIGLMNALPDASSVLAVFKVNTGWWYVCIRNDIILSDGDMLFVNEEEAKEQFTSMLAVPDWQYKIAPAEWNIEDAKEINVDGFLIASSRDSLQKVHALRGTKLLVVLTVATIAAIWLLSTVVSLIFSAKPQRPIVAPVAIKKIQAPVAPPEPKPWESLRRPDQILAFCYQGVQDLVTISTPGWHIGGITCSPEGLVTSWRMEIGRLSWIDKALETSGLTFSNRSISPNGTEVLASVPMPNIDTFNSPPKLNGVDLVNTINDLFQGLQMPVSLNSQTWTSPQNKVYKYVGFSFSSKHNPMVWIDLLTKFSGLTINLIKYDTNTNSWYYEGAIYVL
ncbi:MAG: type 4b pilus protein PilO2 [Alphaproteobacteria bacterium]|nr:type 4b pilus protein PilO2 [Alphaproteobacteria bacterium]